MVSGLLSCTPFAPGDTRADDPVCWFYAVDNKSRDPDKPTHPTDPVFGELREALIRIVEQDQRTVPGLDGTSTHYRDFQMPIRAVEMLTTLRHNHGNVCTREDITREANLFAFDPTQVKLLTKMFHNLGMLLHFPDVPGCEHLVILEVQWLVNAVACIIREEDNHGSLLQELLADAPSGQSWHVTPTGVLWKPDDIRRGWFPVGLLDYIWGHKIRFKKTAAKAEDLSGLKILLNHFNLVYPMTRNLTQFFVVPALAPSPPPRRPLPPSVMAAIDPTGQMPTEMLWQLDRLKQRHGENVEVSDFKLDFTRENFLPEERFERLVCAVASEISSSLGENVVNFYRGEATFSFDKRYMHAKLHPLSIQVHSINYDASSIRACIRACQYSLCVFLKCALESFSTGDMYDVWLGYPVQEEPHMQYAGICSQNRDVQKIWLNGESFANTYAKWWNDMSRGKQRGGLKLRKEYEQLVLIHDSNKFSCKMNEIDFTICAKELVAHVVPKLLGKFFAELWRVQYNNQEEQIRNWDDQTNYDRISTSVIGATDTSSSHSVIKDSLTRRKALSGQRETWNATDCAVFWTQGRGLIHKLIPDVQLQKDVTESIEVILDTCGKIHSIDELEMSIDDLARMVNDFFQCVETVRRCYQYLATSSSDAVTGKEQNELDEHGTRLSKTADELSPHFKTEIEKILFWKEAQYWAIRVNQVC